MTTPDGPTKRLEHFLDNVLRKDLAKVLAERDNCYNAASQCAQLRQLLTDLLDLGKVRQVTIDVAADDVPISEEANRLANAGEERISAAATIAMMGSAAAEHGKPPVKITEENRRALEELLGVKTDDDDSELGTAGKNRTVLHKTVTICDALVADPTPLQLLCDVSGNSKFEVEEKLGQANAEKSGSASSGNAPLVPSESNNSNYHFFMTAEIANPALIHINIGCGVICPMTHEEAVVFLKKKEQLYRDMSQRLSRESLRVRFRIRLVMEAINRMQEQTLSR